MNKIDCSGGNHKGGLNAPLPKDIAEARKVPQTGAEKALVRLLETIGRQRHNEGEG